MKDSYSYLVIISLGILSIVTRVIPFVIGKYMSDTVSKLGKSLPAYIMLLLVIYEIKPQLISTPPYAWQAFVALGLLLTIHLWRRNTLLSLTLGTVSYLLLLNL